MHRSCPWKMSMRLYLGLARAEMTDLPRSRAWLLRKGDSSAGWLRRKGGWVVESGALLRRWGRLPFSVGSNPILSWITLWNHPLTLGITLLRWVTSKKARYRLTVKSQVSWSCNVGSIPTVAYKNKVSRARQEQWLRRKLDKSRSMQEPSSHDTYHPTL